MIVLVTGGRKFADAVLLNAALSGLNPDGEIDIVIHGGAPGTDTLADTWARHNGVQPVRCDALWRLYDASVAGSRRNRLMLLLKPDLVVAFKGGRGTADMVRQARAANIPVMTVG